jgi:urocanate hydratase
MVGVARRSWARNPNAMAASREYNNLYPESDHITLPFVVEEDVLSGLTKDGTMK